jgi:hypothetical protein
MNTNQKKYTAFMESVCKEFNHPEILPALNAGFKAFCEASSSCLMEGIERQRKKKTGQYFKRNDTTGHTELYDTVLKALESKYEVLESEDCDPNSNRFASGVSASVMVNYDPDSTPYEIFVHDYGYKYDLSYSIYDEYGNNLKDYISACRGAPLGSKKGYFDLNLLISDLMRDLGKLEHTPEDSDVNY